MNRTVEDRQPASSVTASRPPPQWADPREALTTYLATCKDGQEGVLQTPVPATGARRVAQVLVPMRHRARLRTAATWAVIPVQRRRAADMSRTGGLRLHLGSGHERRDGWVNVDLVGSRVDLAWDLSRPLPLADGSADVVFHEHLLEHLDLRAGLRLLDECHRVLAPNGILRVAVPDAGALTSSYLSPDGELLAAARPGRPTRLLALQEFFYWYRHRTMYDVETLQLVCQAAGFTHVRHRAFGKSDISPCPDSPARRLVSLYVEARA